MDSFGLLFIQQYNLLCLCLRGWKTWTSIGLWVTFHKIVWFAPVYLLALSTVRWFQSVQYIKSSNKEIEKGWGTPSNTMCLLLPSISAYLKKIRIITCLKNLWLQYTLFFTLCFSDFRYSRIFILGDLRLSLNNYIQHQNKV